jgi:hypothetical protein
MHHVPARVTLLPPLFVITFARFTFFYESRTFHALDFFRLLEILIACVWNR